MEGAMKAMESKVMRAMRLANTSTGKPQFTEAEVPQPKPGSGEVLVRVHAAGVTASEVIWQPTTNTKDGGPRSNAILAHEFSGTIAATASDVRDFRTGQEIYGMNDWYAEGALAEYCVTQPASIALCGGFAFTGRLQQLNSFINFFFQGRKIVVGGPCFRLSFHFASKFQ